MNLAFLGANAVYRHIRLEPSPLGDDRHEVCYKTDLAKEDPMWGVDPAEVTSNWPDGPVPRPEQELVGSQYADVDAKADMVVADRRTRGSSPGPASPTDSIWPASSKGSTTLTNRARAARATSPSWPTHRWPTVVRGGCRT